MITLANLVETCANLTKDLAVQDEYVKALGARITAGEKTIKVFDQAGQQWTEVKLVDFWQVQYDKYLAMSGYVGDMNGLATTLQQTLDAALKTIVLPEDRVKAAAQAAAKA